MVKQTFDDLTTPEKFKAVRDDIRLAADHISRNQRELNLLSQTVGELRSEIQTLRAEIAALANRPR